MGHDTSRIIHRDIKPENILINSMGEVKLSDFGVSKELSTTPTCVMTSTPIGTHVFMSPERITMEDYSFTSDIWSVGMVICQLATGVHPFSGCRSIADLYDLLCERP